ncbi:hypothetical protein VTN96DRAFT_9912 [Rasamsonia emersonii]|uniref:Uncharacterized protein n=1 Tax=Rasamsonia emersonii (strain ATCC 16479 / CBS 393.64 / IMI 116815) TaxID=1408163 RepID=A0A0F4Z180_RASE3|nr:hypothetical protein T310_1705 [Rasamsonia emersonii CBS 393.64]KKA24272.1 hypothetical protein T310_1705 [Rasamsonia emersonii CBS 393.64]
MAGKRRASTASEQRPTKKAKITAKDASPPPARPRNSWDRLTKVWLTPRALDEVDRRTATAKPPHPPRPDPSLLDLPVEDLRALKRFSRHGGPDLTDLRGFPDPWWEENPNENGPNPPVRPPRATMLGDEAAYDRNFEQAMEDNGIHPEGSERPGNWDAIIARMARRRWSLASDNFGREEFDKFLRTNAQASRGVNAPSSVFPTLRGDGDNSIGNRAILHVEDRAFDNMEPIIPAGDDDDTKLALARPNSYDGGRAGQLDARMRSELGAVILPSTEYPMRILPNFTASATRATESAAILRRQALHAGALGARAMHSLQSYGEGPDARRHDRNAYAITATYQDGTLRLYAVHAAPSTCPEERASDYHMNELGAWPVARSRQAFRQGVGAFRNLREWALEKRDEFVEAANRKVTDTSTTDIVVEVSVE